MTSITLRSWSATRFARWLVPVIAMSLLIGGLSATRAHADGVECPSGINRPGCTHYYINHRGEQVPKSNSGRGIMVGGSEVQVLSGLAVRVTSPVQVAPNRYEYRTSGLSDNNGGLADGYNDGYDEGYGDGSGTPIEGGFGEPGQPDDPFG